MINLSVIFHEYVYYPPQVIDGSTVPQIILKNLQGVTETTNYLIDDSIKIKERVEFKEVFDFTASDIELKFINTPYLSNIFRKENLIKRIYGLELKDGDVSIGWYVIDSESVIYDKTNDIYIISAVGWIKFFIDTWAVMPLPDYDSFEGPHQIRYINNFLAKVSEMFTQAGVIDGVIVNTGLMNRYIEEGNLIRPPLSGYLFGYRRLHYEAGVQKDFFVADFIKEAQKHFAAYIYVGADKKLYFINRNLNNDGGAKDITDLIIDNNYNNQPYEFGTYDSLLINISTRFWDYQGWALIWWDGVRNVLQKITAINMDLSNIPVGNKYLDLRQNWRGMYSYPADYFIGFETNIFGARRPEHFFNDYKELLMPRGLIEIYINHTQLKLQDKVKIGTGYFLIREREIEVRDNTDKLKLVEYV